MMWRNMSALMITGILAVNQQAYAKQVVYPEVSDVEKPQIKAKYTAEQPNIKKQLSIGPTQSNTPTTYSQPTLEPFNVLQQTASTLGSQSSSNSGGYVGEKPQTRVLTNDYPLRQSSSVPSKPTVRAKYSEHGIVSDLGVEKRKVYQYKQANGVMVFSDQQPLDADYQVLLYECFACRPDSTIDWYKIPLFTSHFASDVALAARQYQLDPALIRAVIHAESAFKPSAISKAGAKGLMQLMPATAKQTAQKNKIAFNNVKDLYDPNVNIMLGSAYYSELLKQFNGNRVLATAAYNAGPGSVRRWLRASNGTLDVMTFIETIPYTETREYVQAVLSYRMIYQHNKQSGDSMFSPKELSDKY